MMEQVNVYILHRHFVFIFSISQSSSLNDSTRPKLDLKVIQDVQQYRVQSIVFCEFRTFPLPQS